MRGSLESGVVDSRHHEVAACIGGNRGGAIVGEIHGQAYWHGGRSGSTRAAIENRRQIAERDRGDGLDECFRSAQRDGIDLDKLGRDISHTIMLPTRTIAGIGHQLNAVDAGESHAPSGQRQPCTARAHPCASGPNAGIQISEELQRDGIGCRPHQVHCT